MKTVIFLHHPVLNDTFAYFPLEKWDRMGNRKCFDIDSYFNACSPDYAAECDDATEEQCSYIKHDLENAYGYNLNILLKNDLVKSK